jgi:uncharacterized coiled-coil DUF342 family protein
VPDLDDPALDSTDPDAKAVLQLRKEFADVKAKHGYLAEISRSPVAGQAWARNRDNRKDQLRGAVEGIKDAMRNYDRTLQQTRELKERLTRLQRQIRDSENREQATHQNIVRAHADYWKLTNWLMDDYRIPPRPGAEADTSNQ